MGMHVALNHKAPESPGSAILPTMQTHAHVTVAIEIFDLR